MWLNCLDNYMEHHCKDVWVVRQYVFPLCFTIPDADMEQSPIHRDMFVPLVEVSYPIPSPLRR